MRIPDTPKPAPIKSPLIELGPELGREPGGADQGG